MSFNEPFSASSWSFGILFYEIVTLGSTPYPAIGAEQLLKILKTGYRMERPAHCNQQLYDSVMASCWNENDAQRPSFDELSDKLKSFMKLDGDGVGGETLIDLQRMFDKCISNET